MEPELHRPNTGTVISRPPAAPDAPLPEPPAPPPGKGPLTIVKPAAILDDYTPPADGQEPSLFRKLAEATLEIGPVEMTGYNSFDNFPYATETDINKAVRGPLAQRNIKWGLTEAGRTTRTVPTRDGTPQPIVDVLVRFTFYDGDSGETYSFQMTGTGIDYGGNGTSSAITSAVRGALGKQFMIELQGEPQQDRQAQRPARQRSDAGGGQPRQAETAETWRWPFDRDGLKGKPLAEIPTKNLEWFVNVYTSRDERYREQTEARKAWARAELARRDAGNSAGNP